MYEVLILIFTLALAIHIYTDFKEMLQSQHKDTMQTVVAIEKLTEEVRVNSVELAHLQQEMAHLRKRENKQNFD